MPSLSKTTLFACAVIASAACGDTPTVKGAPDGAASVAGAQPIRATIELKIGQSRSLSGLSARAQRLTGFGWRSTDAPVLTVSPAGVATARSVGRAYAVAPSSVDSILVVVTEPENSQIASVATVSVQVSTPSIVAGGTAQVVAVARSADGTVLNGRPIAWATSHQTIATVSASGMVTGVGTGTANMIATVGGVVGFSPIQIVAAAADPITSVTVTSPSSTLTVGAQLQLSVTARTAGGIVTGLLVTWTSDNPAVASASADGTVTGISAGTVGVTARVAGVSGVVALRVLSTVGAPFIVNEPELPRATVPTTGITFVTGRTIRVPVGGDLQVALDTARRGDEILLPPGSTYMGQFVYPAKSGTGWVTLRTDVALPPVGTRMTPTMASQLRLAKLVSPGTFDVLAQEAGSSNFRVVGIEFTVAPQVTLNYGLVTLGTSLLVAPPSTLERIPRNIILDQVYVHGRPTVQNLSRCITLNSAWTAVVNSWVSECHAQAWEAQAIGGWGSPGPVRVENNYLEGAGQNLYFGGADPVPANTIISDVEIRGNHMFKPVSWIGGPWIVKNTFELKSARRVLVENNVLENNWIAGQNGFIIVWNSTNQNGECPLCQTTDVTFRYNIVRNTPGGVNLAARPNPQPALPTSRVKMEQNLFYDVGVFGPISSGRMFQFTGDLQDVQLLNNTAVHNGEGIAVNIDGPPMDRLVIRNNVLTLASFGVFGNVVGSGTVALRTYARTWDFTNNVLAAGGPSSGFPSQYPDGNAFATLLADVGFVNPAGRDFRLSSSSPFRTFGFGGTLPGANIDEVMRRTAGVVISP